MENNSEKEHILEALKEWEEQEKKNINKISKMNKK